MDAVWNQIEKRWLAGPIEGASLRAFQGYDDGGHPSGSKVRRADSTRTQSRDHPRGAQGDDLARMRLSGDRGGGLYTVHNGDGPGSVIELEGVKCWAPGPDGPDKQVCLYFNADDLQAFETKKPLIVTIDFFDAGTDEALIEYDSHDVSAIQGGAYKTITAFRQTGTSKWMEAKIKLTDPRFIDRQNNGADFRITMPKGVLKIRKVSVSPAW